jgi:flagellar secretion chaperone FliS
MATRVSVYLEQEILSATGLQLVHLLYQAAISELREARTSLAKRDVANRCRSISKACEFLGELRGSLNHQEGGEIATGLDQLYCYMLGRLLDANLRQEDAPLAEVVGLLSTLDEAWKHLAAEQLPEASELLSGGRLPFGDGTDVASNAWSL